MDKQYSGNNSKEFWEIVNSIDDENLTLYKLGCDLQNLEEKVFHKINERRQIIKQRSKSSHCQNYK
jgi:hypothetical protein